LRNLSALVVNHLEVTFRDSTEPPLEEALNSNAIAEDEGAELEHYLYNCPSFTWKQREGSTTAILGNNRQELCIEAHGKRGLIYGVIRVVYTHIHEAVKNPELQHRQLELDLAVTVNASLELLTYDFLPLRPSPLSFSPGDSVASTARVRNECLVVLEIRNSWIQPLNMALSVQHPVGPPRVTSYLFQSGQTRRIIASLPRTFLSTSKVKMPPPRKEKTRQFVVSTSVSELDVAAAREAWWYRQHVLDCITATWSEIGGSARTGKVELRGIRLNQQHIQAIKYEVVEATIEMIPTTTVDQKFCYGLVVKVKNHHGNISGRRFLSIDLPLTCCFRLIITPSEDVEPTSRSFCIDGLLQSPAISIPPNENTSWTTEVTLLARGQFEVGVVIQEQSKDITKTGRRWFAEPCTINTDLVGLESRSEGRAPAETRNANSN
jgi:trafficking protein particle complex subunit 9